METIREDAGWAGIHASTRAQIEHVLTTVGDEALASELTTLINQPGFGTRLSELSQASLVDLMRLNRESAAGVNERYGELKGFFQDNAYERLSSGDQGRVRAFLSDFPGSAEELAPLVDSEGFRGLSEEQKEDLFERLTSMPNETAARAMLGVERFTLGMRTGSAEEKAERVLEIVTNLERAESGWSVAGLSLLSPLAGGGLVVGNYFGQDRWKNEIAELLGGEDGDAVYRALEREGEGRVHDMMEQLLEEPGDGDTRTRLVKILDALNPDSAARFISNLSHGIGKELDQVDIFDAVAKGFSLSGTVDGVGVAVRDGAVSISAPEFNVEGHTVKDLKLGFDPKPLREALKEQEQRDYRHLLTEVLDSFTKNHELDSSPLRWSDSEKREYLEAIRRLPGGGGASDLSAPVSRPG